MRRLGAHRALWITTLACALLTYGGVVVFVVIFAIYPLGLKLLQQADIPKRLFCAALALGAGATFIARAIDVYAPHLQPGIAMGEAVLDALVFALYGVEGEARQALWDYADEHLGFDGDPLEAAPDSLEQRRQYALLLAQSGRPRLALEQVRELQRRGQSDTMLTKLEADLLGQLDRVDEAIELADPELCILGGSKPMVTTHHSPGALAFVLSDAEGSVLVEFGDTRVLCTASVETGVPGFLRGKGQGWVTAEYGMLPRSTTERMGREAARGKQGGRTMEIQRLIGRSLRAAIDLEALGEIMITLDCDVIQADGGTRTASITGGWVALRLAVNKLMKAGDIISDSLLDPVAAVTARAARR